MLSPKRYWPILWEPICVVLGLLGGLQQHLGQVRWLISTLQEPVDRRFQPLIKSLTSACLVQILDMAFSPSGFQVLQRICRPYQASGSMTLQPFNDR